MKSRHFPGPRDDAGLAAYLRQEKPSPTEVVRLCRGADAVGVQFLTEIPFALRATTESLKKYVEALASNPQIGLEKLHETLSTNAGHLQDHGSLAPWVSALAEMDLLDARGDLGQIIYELGTRSVENEDGWTEAADVLERERWLLWLVRAQRSDADVIADALGELLGSSRFDAGDNSKETVELMGRMWHHPLRGDLVRDDMAGLCFLDVEGAFGALFIPSERWSNRAEREVFIRWVVSDFSPERPRSKSFLAEMRNVMVRFPSGSVGFRALAYELAFKVNSLLACSEDDGRKPGGPWDLIAYNGALDDDVVFELSQSSDGEVRQWAILTLAPRLEATVEPSMAAQVGSKAVRSKKDKRR